MISKGPIYADRIVQDPEIMVGKPVIEGTRIPVEQVIVHVAHTPNPAHPFAAYPRLTIEDARASLAYAHAAVAAKPRPTRRKSPPLPMIASAANWSLPATNPIPV